MDEDLERMTRAEYFDTQLAATVLGGHPDQLTANRRAGEDRAEGGGMYEPAAPRCYRKVYVSPSEIMATSSVRSTSKRSYSSLAARLPRRACTPAP